LSITIVNNATANISGKIKRQDQTFLTAGIVSLYKQQTSQYDLTASVPVESDGSYLFTKVPAGNYIIKVVPQSSENALPTYYGDTEMWYEASIVAVGDASVENIDITIIPIPEIDGNSGISGYVYEEPDGKKGISNTKGENPAPDIAVYLQRHQTDWKTVAQTLTNEIGYYQFKNISAGTYRVILDVPGLNMNDITIIELGEGEEVENIDYTITNDGINSVGISEIEAGIGIQVYPNPTSGELRIETFNMRYEICDIAIFDVMGRNVQSSETLNPKSETLNISHLANGIYFLRITTENGVVTRKVVKQ
jgi:hypothetical protein